MPPKGTPPRLTHFLCIPLVTATSRPQLQKSLHTLRTLTKNDCTPENPHGLPEQAIRPPGTLHLTLGVMSLLTPARIDGALALLRSLDLRSLLATVSSHPAPVSAIGNADSSLQPGSAPLPVPLEPLTITLRGLASMHPPESTSVLYSAPVDADGRLYAFCSAVRAALAEFLVVDDRPLLLHATIVNTIYVPGVRLGSSSGAGEGHGRRKARMTFDAREWLERCAEVVWMDGCRVEKVAICRMGAKKCIDAAGRETGDEEYVVEGVVELPAVE